MLLSRIYPYTRLLVPPLTAAGIGIFLAPVPAAIKPTHDQATHFELPVEVAPRNYESDLPKLDGRNLWGNVRALTDSPVLTDPKWWLSGTAGVDKDRFVIFEREGSPPEFLKVGDQLPGKVKILEIQADTLCILVDGKKRKLPVLSK